MNSGIYKKMATPHTNSNYLKLSQTHVSSLIDGIYVLKGLPPTLV